MTPIEHTAGPFETQGEQATHGKNLCVVESSTHSILARIPWGESCDKPNARLFALAPTAPHSCTVPDCPGPENLRKLEAFEGLLEAAKRAFDSTHIDADDLDIALNALSWIRGGLEVAIAKTEGRETT